MRPRGLGKKRAPEGRGRLTMRPRVLAKKRSLKDRLGMPPNLALQGSLYLLRVLQVCRDGRPGLLQERLQLRVLRAGNEGLVDGVEHRLMVGDLVVDVRLVERRTVHRCEGLASG